MNTDAILRTLVRQKGMTRFRAADPIFSGVPQGDVFASLRTLMEQGLVARADEEGDLLYVTGKGLRVGTQEQAEPLPRAAAATYIPTEDDVDPDTLAEGKGKQDIEGTRDFRDDNFGDRVSLHTSSLTAKMAGIVEKVSVKRDLKSNSLVVTAGGHPIATWTGDALDRAMEDGTLNPRNIEASAIDHLISQRILTPRVH